MKASPEWRNWQTRRIQNPFPARECGFESHLRYWRSPARTEIGPLGSRPSGRRSLGMGYVLGMFVVISTLAVALGGIYLIFSEPKVRDEH